MNDIRQAENWVEGFVKAAEAHGVPEDKVTHLLKVARQLMSYAESPEKFEQGYKEAMANAGVPASEMEKQGIAWAAALPWLLKSLGVGAIGYGLHRGARALSPSYDLSVQNWALQRQINQAQKMKHLQDMQRHLKEQKLMATMSDPEREDYIRKIQRSNWMKRMQETDRFHRQRMEERKMLEQYYPQPKEERPRHVGYAPWSIGSY